YKIQFAFLSTLNYNIIKKKLNLFEKTTPISLKLEDSLNLRTHWGCLKKEVKKEIKMNELGQFLKELRKKKKLSIRKASEGIEIRHTYLDSLEKGYDQRTNKKRKPTPDILKKISIFYDVPYTTLMVKAGYGDKNNPVPVDSFFELLDRSPSELEKIKDSGEIVGVSSGGKTSKANLHPNDIDLHRLLTSDETIHYDKTILKESEKNKIDSMIKIMLKDGE